LNIIIPLAGKGSRLSQAGYKVPKPLIKIGEKTIMQWAIDTIGLKGNFIFCCKKEHIQKFNLDEKLRNIIPNCKIISINEETEGTAQTILQASEFIDNDEELFISDSDHFMIWDYNSFSLQITKKPIDACVMVYPDKQTSNAYSYVKINDDGFVTESAEKIPISAIAVAGMHYYKKGSDFVTYAKKMISKNIRFNNEFYVTPVYNQLIMDGKKIITYPIERKWPLGDPDEIIAFRKRFKND